MNTVRNYRGVSGNIVDVRFGSEADIRRDKSPAQFFFFASKTLSACRPPFLVVNQNAARLHFARQRASTELDCLPVNGQSTTTIEFV